MDARPLASFSTPASPMKFWDRLSSGKIGKVQLWHSSFTSYNCVKNGFFMDTICVIFKGINVSKLTLAISDISKNLKRLIASQLQSLLFGFSQDWKTKKKKKNRKCVKKMFKSQSHEKPFFSRFQIQSWNHMIYSLQMLERMQRRQNLDQFRENFRTVLNSKPTIQNTTRYNQHWMYKRMNRK